MVCCPFLFYINAKINVDSSADYDYAPVPQNNNSYSSYNNAGAYSGYSTAGGYDSSTEYSAVNTQSMNNAAPDPYAYGELGVYFSIYNFTYFLTTSWGNGFQ